MAEHLTQPRMEWPDGALAPHGIAAFPLEHATRRLHRGALVIGCEDLLPLLPQVVIHLRPDVFLLWL
jgi:hypothetical protein